MVLRNREVLAESFCAPPICDVGITGKHYLQTVNQIGDNLVQDTQCVVLLIQPSLSVRQFVHPLLLRVYQCMMPLTKASNVWKRITPLSASGDDVVIVVNLRLAEDTMAILLGKNSIMDAAFPIERTTLILPSAHVGVLHCHKGKSIDLQHDAA